MATPLANTAPSFAALTGMSVPVHIVDVGANAIDGTPPYQTLLDGGATLVGFEPNPTALERLFAAKRETETYLPHAIGDSAQHTLHICAAEGMTSLLCPNPAVLNLFHGFPQWARVVHTRTVETVKLSDIPEARGAAMLKIDIQGGELMAMTHAGALLNELLVIQTEVEFLPMYVGQPLFSDIDQFLRKHGFVLHRFFPAVSRVITPMVVNNDIFAGMSQAVWADAVFVRDFTALDTFSDAQLLTAAAILHDCYASFDLALHLLLEYDKRLGSGCGAAYLEQLQSQPQAQAA